MFKVEVYEVSWQHLTAMVFKRLGFNGSIILVSFCVNQVLQLLLVMPQATLMTSQYLRSIYTCFMPQYPCGTESTKLICVLMLKVLCLLCFNLVPLLKYTSEVCMVYLTQY